MERNHTAVDAPWVKFAKASIGQSETLGPNDSPWIRKVLASLAGSWLLGQPWCGAACARWMKDAGKGIPKHWYRAKGWLDWGTPLKAPVPGCVCVLEREGGGHVFLVLGKTAKGDLVGIGGNQGNKVSIAAFPVSRVVGYRWPVGDPITTDPLPILTATGSASEA